MKTATQSLPARSRAILAVAFGAFLIAALVVSISTERAASAPLRVVILGKTTGAPQPLCPGKYEDQLQSDGTTASVPIVECLTEGHMTGFQIQAAGVNQPFKAPFDGKIVSWSISLGRPSNHSTQSNPDSDGLYQINELSFFNQLLGKPSTARIGILREIQRADRKTFKMVRQSPVEILNPYFGTTPQFVLDHPLTIVRDQVVAITIPTWAPLFAKTVSNSDTYRASRIKPDCTGAASITGGRPQQKVGSQKIYTCTYVANRLLYTATLVKKPGG